MTDDRMTRRDFLAAATAMGAALAWPGADEGRELLRARAALVGRIERRDLYPEGVASGDPHPDSVLLWTRRPPAGGASTAHVAHRLLCEVAEDPEFRRVVSRVVAIPRAESDWTVRVLAARLRPATECWYRFTDEHGFGSRTGRTITAPAPDDAHPVRFAFVSCQNVQQGACNAYRRMTFEDERAPAAERLGFVLHLGDFIYELVWYPEDRPEGMYDRRLREIVRYADGEKHADFHVPTTLDDYRAVYRAYLADPDLQDARARWPFVNMWDNHEFSWNGWQSVMNFGEGPVPGQSRKVAANQAWYEYLPSRVVHRGAAFGAFEAPRVDDVPVTRFDEHGLGTEPNNLAAIGSLTAYRAFRYGRHLDLLITDQHSYRSEEPSGRPEARPLASADFPEMIPEEAMVILDAGRAYDDGRPPAAIRMGDVSVPNFRRDAPPQTILGERQKQWLLERLERSTATWKVWGVSQGTLDWRADPQHLPAGVGARWPGAGYACLSGGDHGSAFVERAEIYDHVKAKGIAGFVAVAGDRHSFWAGLASKALPPAGFDPVGLSFVTGSISAPGLVEAFEHRFPKEHPLRALYLADRPGRERPEPTIDMLLRHGVRSCLEYARSGDLAKARALSNPDNAPHLAFVDMGGHGYATVRLAAEAIDVEFVCIPRPVERSTAPDGGPLRYRMVHRAARWSAGARPVLEQRVVEGDAGLGL